MATMDRVAALTVERGRAPHALCTCERVGAAFVKLLPVVMTYRSLVPCLAVCLPQALRCSASQHVLLLSNVMAMPNQSRSRMPFMLCSAATLQGCTFHTQCLER